ncbi:hypothetical protein SDC9_172895 [bioreactor metagenome]|uniref:Uncharacterized protein n=1 Tax=bioreactor metagenome TaxID=1076179 RepID=A0A645GH34_9ZZZZ
MLLIGLGKHQFAGLRRILVAKEEIAVLYEFLVGIQRRLNSRLAGVANGSHGQTVVFVGVIQGFRLLFRCVKHILRHAERIAQARAALQRHVLVQAVVEHRGYL